MIGPVTAERRRELPNAFSIDVEDWFHIVGHGPADDIASWATLPSRVERNTETLLALLDRHRVKATFFVLGWIAERHPRLIAGIAAAGHEIASHGYAHRRVFDQDRAGFAADLERAEAALAAATGMRPRGYRAPSFSITAAAMWGFDVLAARGYSYDSSVFPASRGNGGMPGAPSTPFVLPSGLAEVPVSTTAVLGRRLGFLGGGYLRLLPLPVILAAAQRARARGEPLVLYIHPHDIDAGQPRLPLPPLRAFSRYVGVAGCAAKLDTLLGAFAWGPCEALAARVTPRLPLAA
jgi:polysaccharide deacetylase family protein (PEP-CTERM system associated)